MSETTTDLAVVTTLPVPAEYHEREHDPDIPPPNTHEDGRRAISLAIRNKCGGGLGQPLNPKDPADWHAVADELRQARKAAVDPETGLPPAGVGFRRVTWLSDMLNEAIDAEAYLKLWPMLPRPLLSFPGCPPARGFHRVCYWHPVTIPGHEDWLGYEGWGTKGFPGGGEWPMWHRFTIPVRAGWWPFFRDALRQQVYEAGRRAINADWDPDLAEVDEQIALWAQAGQPVTGTVIEEFAASLSPVPAAPGKLALEADPWAAHLIWAREWSEGRPFTIKAMLSAVQREPGAVPVPGDDHRWRPEWIAADDPTAAIKVGVKYGRAVGQHAGLELRRLPGAHGVLAWQVGDIGGMEELPSATPL